MNYLRRSELFIPSAPLPFLWATGIEDTFISAVLARTGRAMDEYELTDHYNRWEEDFQLMASLGVKYARYGVPWHRIQPSRNEWNWDWADRTLDRLVSLGITPIVDLVHYGVPAWMEKSFLNPDYPSYVEAYTHALASRFKGRIGWYTPFNEPRIAAWYCGKIGWWPPFRRSWADFLRILVQISRGGVL